MKKVSVYLNPLSGLRFSFGQETKGIVTTIEHALINSDVAVINVSTPTQLLATELWCNKQGYELVVYDENDKLIESVTLAHSIVNKEFILLDLTGIDNFSIDINE